MKHGQTICHFAPCRIFAWRGWRVSVARMTGIWRVEAQSATHWFAQDYADYCSPAFVARMAMRGMREIVDPS